MIKLINILSEAKINKCPAPTQNIELNLQNRQKAINEYGYGPLNPSKPNDKFWQAKVKLTELRQIIYNIINESLHLNEDNIDEYDVESPQDVKEFVQFMREYKQPLHEAEYHGRKVQLGKPMQGDVKKFKVYVKNPKGKVVKVNFGFGGSSAKGKRMVIKKNNPKRRKAFRARHNCDSPGPRTKARYWSCRKW